MAKRRPRRPRTFDQFGAASDFNPFDTPIFGQDAPPFDASSVQWIQSSDPDLMQAVVPNGTPLPTDITGISRVFNYPQQGVDTWYAPTTYAIARGKVNAAIETAQAVGNDIAAAAKKAFDYGPMILLGIVAVYLFSQWGKYK